MLDRFIRIEVESDNEAVKRHISRIDQLRVIERQATEVSLHLPQWVQTPIVDALSGVRNRASEEKLDRMTKPIPRIRELIIGSSIRLPLPAKKHR